jgi:ribosomal subunit interface protein
VKFVSLPHSDAVEENVRQKFEALERYSDRIRGCQVWIEKPMGHHRKGRLYEMQVRLTVPGEELVIVDQPPEDDVSIAIRNAFDAIRRKLQDYERRKHARARAHPRRHPRSGEPEPAARETHEAANG